MTKWEYMTTRIPDRDTLNKYGKDGWELITINDRLRIAYFKRPVIAEKLITTGKRLEKLNADMIDPTHRIRG